MTKTTFERLAIVNRGECAMRALRAVADLNAENGHDVTTIAIYTEPDAESWFVRDADEAVSLGPAFVEVDGARKHAYVDHERLERALEECRADAVWVGWGFVAEDADFAALCERMGLVFVGPNAEVMRRLGNKIEAKRVAEAAGVPVTAWTGGAVEPGDEAREAGERIGYPLLVKAAAGGGGRGIRVVKSPDQLDKAIEDARREAASSFGDPSVFMEAMVEDARHVEVQIIADTHGAVWPLGVRDCSVQRRKQKVIEEDGSALLDPETERGLLEKAADLTREAGYHNAGTIEFLLDDSTGDFYFMEVNTRLQVEHPVTEMVTGTDIVKLQLAVASGGALEGDPPPSVGHALEVRLNAEDAEQGFAPAPGTVSIFRPPGGAGVRVDTGVADGDAIAPDFDSMIAKLLAWGRDRDEALARMRRALLETVVVIEGGATNKAFLLGLLNRPELREGPVDIGWLDRLTETGDHVPPHHPLCLVAAAIEAAHSDHEAELATFMSTAARGRPEVDPEPGHVIELRFRGNTYELTVFQIGPSLYRVDTGGGLVDVTVERHGEYERRMHVAGRRHRVIADLQGPTLNIEVDGTPHRIERDDGGIVRAPAPSVVVSIGVEPGDDVASGDEVAVLESMKMQVHVNAPFAGRVREVMAAPGSQVDAGGPLLQMEAASDDEEGDTGERVVFEPPEGADVGVDSCAEILDGLESYLLGFDLDPGSVESVRQGHRPDCDRHQVDHGWLADREDTILRIFTELSGLTHRQVLEGEEADQPAGSPRERLITFLRSIDRAEELLPERFLEVLRATLARHGVDSLNRSDELDEALLRIYRAAERLPELTPAVQAILTRRLEAVQRDGDPAELADQDLLERLARATEGRFATVRDLAHELTYRAIDQPVLEESRASVDAEMYGHLVALGRDLDDAERRRRMELLVDCPQPLRSLLLRTWFEEPELRESVLRVRLRRYYRDRDLEHVDLVRHGDRLFAIADYRFDDHDWRAILGYGEADELDALLADAAAVVADMPEDRGPVVDLALRSGGERREAEDLTEHVRTRAEQAAFPRRVARLDTSFEFAGDGHVARRTVHLTFRHRDGGFVEDRLYRNLHPMLAKRIGLWRLQNFELERLESVEDVYLFRAVGRDNPGDERLFAITEIRDLTPVRDGAGRVTRLPHAERLVNEALSAMRRHLTGMPVSKRPLHNRLILAVRPSWTHDTRTLRELAHRLAPATVGIGLEKVVARAEVVDEISGEPRPVVFNLENVSEQGVVVRVEQPSDEPIPTLSDYEQRVLKTRRHGSVYPYELVRLLSAGGASDFPPGSFQEYDLDDDGELVPVDREYGRNTANLVVGVISNRTDTVPEGMRRVLLASDPSQSLGSLAEPECRRIIAALQLAAREKLPVEWFTISSGARISMSSGTENMDWIGAALREIVEFTQGGGEINVIVTGINVGAQPYFNAEATMLMHTSGVLIMTPDSAMVLTGKQALDFSGGVSAEDNLGIGGYERIMGPNGQAQYWAPTVSGACQVLFRHYDHAYVVPGERFPRRAATADPVNRDVRDFPHADVAGTTFDRVGQVFSMEHNPERKKPFDIRSVMRAVTDQDHEPLERWSDWRHAESTVVWDAHVDGWPVTLLGLESRPLTRRGVAPADGPTAWTPGTLFPQASRKMARAINAASGNRPVVVLANLAGFDGSPESMRQWQLEYGAEIGRAVTNFDGPIVFVVISRYHGGAFVVFSQQLNPGMEVAAVEGSYASVIGGTPAAAVVFAREVRDRTDADDRVKRAREAVEQASGDGVGDAQSELDRIYQEVHNEKLNEIAAEFDSVHDIERAREVGSVDHIVAPERLRPYLAEAIRRGVRAAERGERGDAAVRTPVAGE